MSAGRDVRTVWQDAHVLALHDAREGRWEGEGGSELHCGRPERGATRSPEVATRCGPSSLSCRLRTRLSLAALGEYTGGQAGGALAKASGGRA